MLLMADKITVRELMSQKNDFVIIDVRESDELEGGQSKTLFTCLWDYLLEMQRKNKLEI
jgi:rhodanese-related sulfurtransferase